jgi:hypothetical protein
MKPFFEPMTSHLRGVANLMVSSGPPAEIKFGEKVLPKEDFIGTLLIWRTARSLPNRVLCGKLNNHMGHSVFADLV